MEAKQITSDSRLAGLVTNTRASVTELSFDNKVLLVFLRQFACVFCREALKDLSLRKDEYHKKGITLVFVHMTDNEQAEMFFRAFNLGGVQHVSDPKCSYYSAFELGKASMTQLFGFKNMIRAVSVNLGKGIPIISKNDGDRNQMPGIFLIDKGKVINSFRHKYPGEVPDYDAFIS